MTRPDSSASKAAAMSLKQWPLLIVVAGVAVGLVVVFIEWRMGCLIIGSALGIGAVERMALPRRDAGLLQVRSRTFDIVIMLAMGAAIITLAIVVPDGAPRPPTPEGSS